MKVGVAVPVYNVVEYVEMCLQSIATQSVPSPAYVVDDASTDGSYEHLVQQSGLYRGLARNDSHRGWPHTLNRAAALAFEDGCDAVFVMAADDWLRVDAMAQAGGMLEAGGHDFVVVYCQQVGEESVVQISSEDARLEDFAQWPPMVNEAVVRRHVWEGVGGYAEDVLLPSLPNGFMEDWDFWIRVFKAGYTNYAVLKEPVYNVRMHEGQLHKQAGFTGADREGHVAAFRELMHQRHPELRPGI